MNINPLNNPVQSSWTNGNPSYPVNADSYPNNSYSGTTWDEELDNLTNAINQLLKQIEESNNVSNTNTPSGDSASPSGSTFPGDFTSPGDANFPHNSTAGRPDPYNPAPPIPGWVGGWSPKPLTDPNVQSTATFAAQQLGGELQSVNSAEAQVVSGVKYHMQISLTDGSEYDVRVYRNVQGEMQFVGSTKL